MKKKYTIQELKDNPKLVVRITNKKDGNKLISAFANKYITMAKFGEGISIVWYDHPNNYSWNWLKDRYSKQIIIDFDNVDFEEENKLPKPSSNRKIIAYECIIAFPKFDKGERLIAVEWDNDGIPTQINLSGSKGDSFGIVWVKDEFAKYWKPIYEEEKIIIQNYTGEFTKPGIAKFGCKKITKSEIEALESLFVKLGEFSVGHLGVNSVVAPKITWDTITKIKAKIKE